MVKLAARILALCLAASAAQAQTAATPVDPQRLALAKQIFAAQGGARNAAAVMKSMEAAMLETAKTPQAKEIVTASMDATANVVLPRLFDEMAGYYALDFNSDELKDILAFYQSPAGQSLKDKAPLLAQQIGGSMAKLTPRMQLSVLDKVCSKTECTPQQQQQLTALKQAIPADQRF
jgi:hypothetical protein